MLSLELLLLRLFVHLEVQISLQEQRLVNLEVQISWQVQHFVNLEMRT